MHELEDTTHIDLFAPILRIRASVCKHQLLEIFCGCIGLTIDVYDESNQCLRLPHLHASVVLLVQLGNLPPHVLAVTFPATTSIALLIRVALAGRAFVPAGNTAASSDHSPTQAKPSTGTLTGRRKKQGGVMVLGPTNKGE